MSIIDSPSDNHDYPRELEASTPEIRTPATFEAGAIVEGLSVEEAATAYGLSVSTIRRLLKAGKITGAAKVSQSHGSAYRIPATALEALGYAMKATQSGAILTAQRANLEAEELTAKVATLEASLELARVRMEAAEARSEQLEANVNDLRTALAKLPNAIEAPSPRRRLFGRK